MYQKIIWPMTDLLKVSRRFSIAKTSRNGSMPRSTYFTPPNKVIKARRPESEHPLPVDT